MTATQPNPQNENELLAKLDRLSVQLEQDRLEREQRQKWDDRTWDAIKVIGTISVSLSIAAAIGLLFLIVRLLVSGS